MAFAIPAATTGIGLLMRSELSMSTNVVGYFLAVVVVALIGGLGPALVAAFSAGLLNFFFTPPYYSLRVQDSENLITLVVMAIVAMLVVLVVDRAARRAQQAARARTEAALLASYARTVLTHPWPLDRLLEKVRENFGMTSVALLERRDGEWHQVTCAGTPDCTEPDEADVDVPVTPDVHLALRGRTLPAADPTVLEAAAGQALLTLRQQRTANEAAEANQRAEANQLRTALLSAVGHDLRTPLTSIKAAVGSLRAPDISLSTEDNAALLATIEESTDRLTGLVDNLLDSSRLASGAVRPRLRPVGYDEIVASALSGVDARAPVLVEVDEHLPHVLADPGLMERVVANVVDNALRHGVLAVPRQVDVDGDGRITHDEPAVAIRASAYGDQVELRVVDHGTGLPKKAIGSVFTPFQRLGDRDATPGVGLGLSVAKGFVDAMGGTIHTEDTPGGGLTIVISLPAQHDHRARGGRRATDRQNPTDQPHRPRLPGRRRRRRRNRPACGRRHETRRRGPRPRPARPPRHHRHPTAPQLERGPDHRPVCPHRRHRQGQHTRRRRRRLHHQTLRHGRTACPPPRRGPPRHRPDPHRRSHRHRNPHVHHRPSRQKVHRDGTEVHLTSTEWGLLEILVRNPGKLIPQKQLLTEVWGAGHANHGHCLRVYFAQLRRKLEPQPSRPRYLITEAGMGYRFEA